MAVILSRGYTRCQVRLQNGVDEQGQSVYVNRVFGRILPDTTNQNIYDVVNAVLSLQSLPVRALRRIDDGELISG